MPDNNRDEGPPRTPASGGVGKLVARDNFSADHPIFWGPNQPYSDINTFEPPDWGEEGINPISIPKVVRMVIGDLTTGVDQCDYLPEEECNLVTHDFQFFDLELGDFIAVSSEEYCTCTATEATIIGAPGIGDVTTTPEGLTAEYLNSILASYPDDYYVDDGFTIVGPCP